MDKENSKDNNDKKSFLRRIFGLNNKKRPQEEGQEMTKVAFFVELVKVIILAFLIIVPIRTFIFQPFFVQGASMEPNFYNGEYLIINELGYKKTKLRVGEKTLFTVDSFKDFERGDVIVFRYPRNPEKYFIKRIVGLPGERVVISEGKVRVYNEIYPLGVSIEEDVYLPDHVETRGDEDFKLKEGEYVVLGDNRNHSSDSRAWGVLSDDYIMGKVLLRAWPFSAAKIFK